MTYFLKLGKIFTKLSQIDTPTLYQVEIIQYIKKFTTINNWDVAWYLILFKQTSIS